MVSSSSEKGRMRTSRVEGGQGGGSESENMSINKYQIQGWPLQLDSVKFSLMKTLLLDAKTKYPQIHKRKHSLVIILQKG